MYKVTNIFTEERGFEAEGKMHVLKVKESILMEKPPQAVEGILTVEKAEKPKTEQKVSPKPEEKKPIQGGG